jgi:hypothetical protein
MSAEQISLEVSPEVEPLSKGKSANAAVGGLIRMRFRVYQTSSTIVSET